MELNFDYVISGTIKTLITIVLFLISTHGHVLLKRAYDYISQKTDNAAILGFLDLLGEEIVSAYQTIIRPVKKLQDSAELVDVKDVQRQLKEAKEQAKRQVLGSAQSLLNTLPSHLQALAAEKLPIWLESRLRLEKSKSKAIENKNPSLTPATPASTFKLQ